MQIDRNAPLRVTNTTIQGNSLTRLDTIERRLQALYNARTVQDVAQGALEGSKRLEQLNIFDKVDLELLPGRLAGECHLKVTVQEKRVLSVKATTFVEQGEGGVEFAMRAGNALGSAEALEISALMGGSEFKGEARRSQMRADLSQPNVWGLPLTLLLSGDSVSQRPLGDSSYEDVSYGVGVKLRSEIGLDVEWSARQRDIFPRRVETNDTSDPIALFAYSAPSEIISAARPNLKSALSMQFAKDWQLPNSQCPRTGTAASLRAEFASPKITGGDVDLFSLVGKFKRTFPISSDISLTTAIEGATVRPLSSDFVHIQDRFFLGGPLFLRGFQPRGAGLKSSDGTASLGGRHRWQARIGVEGPTPDWSILPSSTRAHVFVTAGGLSNDLALHNLLRTESRVSIGCGLAFGIALGRLEANLVYAVKADKADSQSGRLQFGIGGEFL